MTQESDIVRGDWVRRGRSRPWHKAQSVYRGEVLTKCGRFMANKDKKGEELSYKNTGAGITMKPSDAQFCQTCFR